MVFEGFQLLRPEMLWLLLTVAPATILLWRTQKAAGSWRKAIDPHLLAHILVDSRGNHGGKGHWWIALVLSMAVFSAAGPSVTQVDVPVFQRADALVIVLDLSASMAAADTQPSRIRRARQKILDLLSTRNEGVTGMVVYAGDAHVVAPLTDDRRTIENLLPALDPAIMPLPGSNTTDALLSATQLLGAAGVANGHIVLLTDGMPRFEPSDVLPALESANATVSILGIGTAAGAPIPRADGGFVRDDAGEIVVVGVDADELAAFASQLGGRYSNVTLDSSDLDTVLLGPSLVDSGEIQLDRKTDTWLDQGNWIAALLALACLPLFRRGILAALVVMPLFYSEQSMAQTSSQWWQTRDQQGANALERGDAASAAALFENSAWRGTAHYQAENWQQAAESFGRVNDADNLYNMGNALAKAGDYQRAIEAYNASLQLSPDAKDALRNRALVEQLLQQQENQQSNEEGDGDENQQPSESQEQSADNSQADPSGNPSQSEDNTESSQNQSDDDGSEQSDGNPEGQGKQNPDASEQSGTDGDNTDSETMGEAMEQELDAQTQAQLSKFDEALEEQQALEQWLRRVPDDPGGLLRRKFRYESIQRLRKGEEPDEDIRW